jgi:hypothetical protein
MEHHEMKRIPKTTFFDFMTRRGSIVEVLQFDLVDQIMSSCSGIDGPDMSQETVDVDVHVPDTREAVEDAWRGWLARAPR